MHQLVFVLWMKGLRSNVEVLHYDDSLVDQVVRNWRKPNGEDINKDGAVVLIPGVTVSAITVDSS